ncbi:MAG: molybdopterin-dependent oxidoreductase, partial [Proteobacteria bacterium]|nr:molybdopterin-dependent oxidoreductase [Pseudomonadota bacterium]
MNWSRRDFLRIGATGTGAVAAATMASEPAMATTHRRPTPPKVAREVHSVCGVCFWKCGITAEIGEEDQLLHLRGNKAHPMSRGRLCPRGVGGIGIHEDSDRLLHPQIRTGERGEGVFRQATWEQAFAESGAQLQKVVAEHGPGAVAFLTHGSSEAHFGHLAKALGTPHHTHPAYDQCKGPREVGFQLTFGHPLKSPEPIDIENS